MRPGSIWRGLALFGLLLPLVWAGSACSTRSKGPPLPNTSVGAVAPEIEANDLDGQPLKLSDARGKVVLLVFWGDWWGPCRAMYTHQRTLLEKYGEQPFEIVGVNSDTQLERLKLVMEHQKIGWRSFWNGPKGPAGPISKTWGVDAWPTICVLDSKGVIRYRATGADVDAMEKTIERLLAELETPVGDAR